MRNIIDQCLLTSAACFIESFNFEGISFFNTTFPHMVRKRKFADLHPFLRYHFLSNFILECSFFILGKGAQVSSQRIISIRFMSDKFTKNSTMIP